MPSGSRRAKTERVKYVLAITAVVLMGVGVLAMRPTARHEVRDRYRVAEERIEAERARGHLDSGEVERLRLALMAARAGSQEPHTKVLRGEALQRATSEISACRITDLTPWLDEPIGVASCAFTPTGR